MSAREFANLLHDFGPAVANHLWQSTAFAAVAAALAFALRKNQARVRYWIWMAASLKFLVPFALLASAAASLAPARVVAPADAGVYMAVDEVSEPFVLPTLPVEPVLHALPPLHWGALALAALWAVGFFAVLATWCVRWRRVARVVRSAMPVMEGREFAALERIAAEAGVRRTMQMRVSESALEPGVFGIARPVLLWPAAISARLDTAQLDAVLAHEVCHVRRRDNLTALLHMFVEAVFWFHPLVWWVGARLLAERERACDEAVVALCPQPQVYAESILKVCEFCVESPLACVSGVTGADLKRRVVDIMTVRVVRRVTVGAKIAIAAAVMLAVAVPVVLGTTRVLPLYGEIAKASGPLPSFEAVAIKRSRPDTAGKGFRIEGRHFRTINTTAADLLQYAYGVQAGQVEGAPAWLDGEAYDVTGVAPEFSGDKPDWKLMVQKLLADRFGFSFHTGTKEMAVYELHVGKNGPRHMKAAPEREHGGLTIGKSASSPGSTIHAESATMANLAKLLEGTQFDRPVIDRTGISGKFDFEMTFLSDHFKGKPIGPPVEDEPNAPPGIFAAIQDQLGLKLEAAKGPTETLVIDHVQKPELEVAAASPPSAAAPTSASTLLRVAQTQQTAPANPIAFEVVSIHQNKSGGPRKLETTPDGWRMTNMPFGSVIQSAFVPAPGGLAYFSRSNITGLPDWVLDRYDIIAKVPPSEIADWQNPSKQPAMLHAMLQSMLLERCGLVVHRDTKVINILALEVAKGGPKLKPADPNAPHPEGMKVPGEGLAVPENHGFHFYGATMALFANVISKGTSLNVQDHTGLTGKYDFLIHLPAPPLTGTGETAPQPDADDMAGALAEQLGLKLVPTKGEVETLVIDHIDRPTEN